MRTRLGALQQTCATYLDRLETGPQPELAALGLDLTVGETYFLRHIEQFQALTGTVLRQRLTAGRTDPLRLLSAGCASGEEAYSLAIMLQESGVADPSIVGVDLNPASLAKARQARYTSWSLRSVPDAIHRRWFTQDGDHVRLDPRIRDLVRFEQSNLAQDDPALWRPQTYDVVFCRNVLMYFAPDVMARAIDRIARSLQPGGFLFLGSAETLRSVSTAFTLRESDGTFYYQLAPVRPDGPGPADETVRTIHPIRPAATNPASTTNPAVGSEPSGTPELGRTLELMRQERFTEALAVVEALPGPVDDDPELLLLRAALLAQNGCFPAAEHAADQVLALERQTGPAADPTLAIGSAAAGAGAVAHALLATCRESEADLPGAVAHCRAAISLDPGFAMPHLQLGRLAQRAGDAPTASREYAETVRLLPTETERRILFFGGGFDRQALISMCRTQSAEIRVRSHR